MMRSDMILNRILIYCILFSIIIGFGPVACMTIGKNFRFMESYVIKIDTPSYGNENTRKYLDYFNSLGDGKVVSYEKEGNFDRTITITEVGLFEGSEFTIGRAKPRWNYCHIAIKKGLDQYSYAMVLYHEYLHCLGYSHTKDNTDLMYYDLNWPSLENLRKYAKDVKKRRTR